MRRYEIDVGGTTFQSVVNGVNDPNALRVAISIEEWPGAMAAPGSYVRIYGVNLQTLMAAKSFSNQPITVKGGFWSPSLPLAAWEASGNRYGLLHQGIVQAGFGNWRGNDTSLDLLILPSFQQNQSQSGGAVAPGPSAGSGSSGSQRLILRNKPNYSPPIITPRDLGSDISSTIGSLEGALSSILTSIANTFGGSGFGSIPANLIHNLMPGQWLGSAIQQTLSTAFPGVNINLQLSQSLQLAYQDAGFYQNVAQYASQMKQLSASIAGGNNAGIDMFMHGSTITVTDWSIISNATALSYSDLIGQPTWFGPYQIQFSSVMRADLYPTVHVTIPPTVASVEPGLQYGNAPPPPLTFSGDVLLFKVKHVGDSRSPDGQQWRTDCWGYTTGSPQAIAAGLSGAPSAINAKPNYGTSSSSSPAAPNPSRLTRRATRYYH